MLSCARRSSSAFARAGTPSVSPSSSCSKFLRCASTSASSPSEPPPVSSGVESPRRRLPYHPSLLPLKSKMNPSSFSNKPIPPHLLANKGPRPGGRFTLERPITPEHVNAERHHWMPWRASYKAQLYRLRRWRQVKGEWHAKMRKAGHLPKKQKRNTGPGTQTPTVELGFRRMRRRRIYRMDSQGKPVRQPTPWLVFPDGRRVRKVGWRRPNKGRTIIATIPKVRIGEKWKPAFAQGRLDVYDYALEYLQKDRETLKAEIVAKTLEADKLKKGSEAHQKALDKINILEIQSEINVPEVRWNVEHGFYDFHNPAHRHLVEDRWRKKGRLDLLMERVYQMHVVPDLLPAFHPNIDMRVEYPMRPPYNKVLAATTPRRLGDMEPGRFLLPNQTVNQPVVRARAFHLDKRLYTLIMVDPDVPDVENATYQSFCHWIVPNISINIFSGNRIHVENKEHQLRYIPPHPQAGTAYHRYTVFLLRQSHVIHLRNLDNFKRLGFDLRQFVAEYNLMVPNAPKSPIEYPSLPSNVVPGDPRWVGRADPNSIEGGIPGGIRPGGLPGLPGPLGGREPRGGVPKGVRQTAGISGRSGGRGKEDEIGGGVFMFRETHDGPGGEVERIYKDILKVPEPKYQRPKKPERLAGMRELRRYY